MDKQSAEIVSFRKGDPIPPWLLCFETKQGAPVRGAWFNQNVRAILLDDCVMLLPTSFHATPLRVECHSEGHSHAHIAATGERGPVILATQVHIMNEPQRTTET